MDLEMNELLTALNASIDRLGSAAKSLEGTAVRLEERDGDVSGNIEKITASIEEGAITHRELELERKLFAAEQKIAELMAAHEDKAPSVHAATARKTLPTATVQLLAKQGLDSFESVDASALDAALVGLPIEQRIAVKSQLFRTGALVL